jgi:hypothetical protein
MSMASGKSLAAYRVEAKKCMLVCANCHGELEAESLLQDERRLPAAERESLFEALERNA